MNDTATQLAKIIMDFDLSKHLSAENANLRNLLSSKPKLELPPRWISDSDKLELSERQADGSYQVAYKMVPI